MTSVDITTGLDPASEPDFGARLAAVEDLVATWDLNGAQTAARALLDEPGLPPGDRLTARRLLAEALRELGDLDAAYDLAEAVAVQAEQSYGPVDVATVHAWAVLAAVRHDYDEWDAAEVLYHRVLDSGVDETDPVTGAEAARVIRLTRVNLALLQRDRGERPLALAMLNAAYVVHRREYGADDLDTIRIAAELAALHHADGNVPASRRLFTLAHAAARSRLGNRHPFTKAVEWELAAVEPPMPASLLPPAPPATPARPAPPSPPPARPASSAPPQPAPPTPARPAPSAPPQPSASARPAPRPVVGATSIREGAAPADPVEVMDAWDPAGFAAPGEESVGAGDLAAFEAVSDVDDPFDLDEPVGLDDPFDPGAGLDDSGASAPPVEVVPAVAPPGVVGAAAVVHMTSGPAAAGHPGGGAASVEGERRVVVPLKAVAAVVILALVIAAVSILRPSGEPDPSAADGFSAPAASTATAGSSTAGSSTGAPGTGAPGTGASGAGASGIAGADGAGQGGAGAGGEVVRVQDLRLRDDGTALAVTWTGLRSKAVVALSRAGGPPVVVAEVPPGTTSYVVKGVDPVAAYCVVVGPVDTTVAVTPGASVCTGQR